jgi:hypothetical protein
LVFLVYLLLQLGVQAICNEVLEPDVAYLVNILAISIPITLPNVAMLQRQFAPMRTQIYYIAVRVRHIPPILNTNNVIVLSGDLKQ